ncbi:Rossmann-fold NAD(P)-binding domain-containing protein [Dickeya dadantii]|uniref:hypothetical protein n=1 Tax=Dickeya dadantii TaxID=204038 RepID=UPI001CC82622|nr:hypothetical protein [Dickeya dadantii]
MKLLLTGATGLVGHQVLLKALAESRITQVVAPVRCALPAHDKLGAPQVNFEHLPEDADGWLVDALLEAALIPCAGMRTMTTEHLV